METPLGPGLYEDLITNGLRLELEKLSSDLNVTQQQIDSADIPRILGRYASKLLSQVLESLSEEERESVGTRIINRVISEISELVGSPNDQVSLVEESPKILASVEKRLPDGRPDVITRPLLALGDTTFLTNAKGEPQLLRQIESELDSAQSIDILMAFVRWAGVRPLLPAIRRFIESGRSVRLITTTYTNSTEQRALEALVQAGARVKVSYDLTQTRLHAKAWLFERSRGLSTAYIGSSNLTASAMLDGVEWNVRVSEMSNADIIQKFQAVFETYWQSSDYKDYDSVEFASAVAKADQVENSLDLAPFQIEPRPFQQRLLDDISASRSAGFHRNLVVAATGTGKTVMSAFDYLSLCSATNRVRLLFVSHRKEILGQSRKMFAQIMQDPDFGEMWFDGEKPAKFDHVFASIQTLAKQDIEVIEPDYYDLIIIDEAHHVTASSYQRILNHFRPKDLVGLTATPERGDGQSILPYFDDRIAAELRIWEAIEQQYLCPFAYFGIRDGVDLSNVAWRRGVGYDPEELTNVYTSDHQWISLVIQQVRQKVLDPLRMRALGFCVGINHAEFVAEQFNRAGIKSLVLTGNHESAERVNAIRKLSSGEIQAIFTVDIFNEGVDIPAVDTLLLLRPTDSGLLFIQQIGRGLRKSRDKQICTILDFVGHQRREFRFENRFRSLVGGTRRELEKQVREGFPLLPAGCQIHLDAHTQSEILNNLKSAVPSQWSKMVAEFRQLGDCSLRQFLTETGLTTEDLFARNRSFAELRRAAGFDPSIATDMELKLLRGVSRLNHIDDSTRIRAYREWLSQDRPPNVTELTTFARRLARMMSASVTSALKLDSANSELDLIWGYPAVRNELLNLLDVQAQVVDVLHPEHALQPDIPLRIHALYSRIEIQAALDDLKNGKIKEFREGVRYVEPLRTDVFLFTVDKSSSGFSPTTRYRDYAISPTLVHWESQSTTSSSSPTGRRYIDQRSNRTTVLFFGRHSKSDDAYWFLGPANYVSHSGEYPIAFTWRLDFELPAALMWKFAATA